MRSMAHTQRQPPLLPFRYTSLTEENGINKIRLLELLPGDSWEGASLWSAYANSQQLKCSVKPVKFKEDMPGYSAVSYYWGNQDDCVTIQCNGQLRSITRNLYSALDAIRRLPTRPTRYIWADAICINQNDEKEQAQQVALMTKLYQRAAHVFVHLGNSDSDVEPALAAIRKSASAMFTHHGASALQMSLQDWWSLGYQSVEEAKIQIRAFYKFLQRPWFTRVWVIQEYAVARSLIFLCGNHQILEADLINASAWLASSSADTIAAQWGSNPMILLHEIKAEKQVELKRPLLTLLAEFRHRGAKRPHDKIYALYGLAADSGTGSEGLDIKPNYEARVLEVYKELATEFLCRDRSLEVVTLAGVYDPAVPPGMVKSRYPGLPSWVPDWRLPDSTVSVQLLEHKKSLRWDASAQTPTYIFPFDTDPTEFRASGNAIYNPAFSDDGDYLCVQGMILDSIRDIGVANDEYMPVPQQWWVEPSVPELMDKISREADRLCNWIDLVGGESGRYYFNREPMLDVFWQTMRCGHYPHGFQREKQGFMDWYTQTKPIMDIARRCRSQPWLRNPMLMEYNNYALSMGVGGPSTLFLARTNQHTGNRAMFSTSYGYVGMAPKGSRVGDRVAIFEGGSVPFIIRRWGQNWQVVGACYVHGCMHGEAFSPEKTATMILV
ncbi:HET-domain-containing protein [Aspergillus varians]